MKKGKYLSWEELAFFLRTNIYIIVIAYNYKGYEANVDKAVNDYLEDVRLISCRSVRKFLHNLHQKEHKA